MCYDNKGYGVELHVYMTIYYSNTITWVACSFFHKVLHTLEHSCIVNIRITCILYKPEYLYTKDIDMLKNINNAKCLSIVFKVSL